MGRSGATADPPRGHRANFWGRVRSLAAACATFVNRPTQNENRGRVGNWRAIGNPACGCGLLAWINGQFHGNDARMLRLHPNTGRGCDNRVVLSPAAAADECRAVVALLEHSSGDSVYLILPCSGEDKAIEYALGKRIEKPAKIFLSEPSTEKSPWWKLWWRLNFPLRCRQLRRSAAFGDDQGEVVAVDQIEHVDVARRQFAQAWPQGAQIK